MLGTGNRSAGSGGTEGLLRSRDYKPLSGEGCNTDWGQGVRVWGALGFRAGIPGSFAFWSPMLILFATLTLPCALESKSQGAESLLK